MSSIFQNIDFNVLPAKSQSLFMRIKGHIDCVALDAPADILRNGFPITRDIHPAAQRNKGWIYRDFSMPYPGAAGCTRTVARIIGAIASCRNIYCLTLMNRFILRRQSRILHRHSPLFLLQLRIGLWPAYTIGGQAICFLEGTDCSNRHSPANPIGISPQITLINQKSLNLLYVFTPGSLFYQKISSKSRCRQ